MFWVYIIFSVPFTSIHLHMYIWWTWTWEFRNDMLDPKFPNRDDWNYIGYWTASCLSSYAVMSVFMCVFGNSQRQRWAPLCVLRAAQMLRPLASQIVLLFLLHVVLTAQLVSCQLWKYFLVSMFNLVTASMVKANSQSSARTKGIDIGLFIRILYVSFCVHGMV